MRYKGFTLAEVLITLGVIGVVAAMTLPTLIQEHREKARVTQVKKAYSILSQAFTMAVQEYGDIEDWELTTTSTGKTDEDGNAVYETSGQILLRNRLAQYVKQLDKPNKLEFRSFKALDGRYFKSDTYTSFDTDTGFFLADGTYVNVGWIYLGCSNSVVHVEICLCFYLHKGMRKWVLIGLIFMFLQQVFNLWEQKKTPKEVLRNIVI